MDWRLIRNVAAGVLLAWFARIVIAAIVETVIDRTGWLKRRIGEK